MSLLSRELSDLGPLFNVLESVVTQTSSQTEIILCSANALRYAVIISPPTSPAERYAVSTVTGNIALGGGRSLGVSSGAGGVGSQVAEWDTKKYGPLPQRTLYGGIQGGAAPPTTVQWGVIEILLVPG